MPRAVSPRRQRIIDREATTSTIVSPTGRDVTLPPVLPNAAVKAKYQAKIEALITAMQTDIVRTVSRAYKANPPELASDASPALTLANVIKGLARKWQKRFNDAAPSLAEYFATAVAERSKERLQTILRDGGWSVRFDPTRTTNDIFHATLTENVGLIRSIASEHLTDVQGMVMRSVQAGRDLSTLTGELQKSYGVTYRRAKLIALDQNNKATSSLTRARQAELGLTEAVWAHSGAGKHPRPDHVKAGRDKLRYDIREGALISGKLIFPGEEINCRCTGRIVVPGFD